MKTDVVYRLTYDMNGGQGGPASSRKVWVGGTHYEYYGYQAEATTATLAKSPKPTRDDCEFVGWSNSRHDPIAHDARQPGDVIDSYTVTGHKTVYAVWRWKAREIAVYAAPIATRGRALAEGFARIVSDDGGCVTYGSAHNVFYPNPKSPKALVGTWGPYDNGRYGQMWYMRFLGKKSSEHYNLFALGNGAMALDSTGKPANQQLGMYPRLGIPAQDLAFDHISGSAPSGSTWRVVAAADTRYSLAKVPNSKNPDGSNSSDGKAVFRARHDSEPATQRWKVVYYDPYTKTRLDRIPNWPKATCVGMRFGLYSDAACTRKLEEVTIPKEGWTKFRTLADRTKTYYVKPITQPAGCWHDWLARPVTGFQGGVAWFAPMTNIYTVTFQRRTEGGGLATVSTLRVFWHDSATAPTPPAVDGFDPYGTWRQTKGKGGIDALRQVGEDLTYELAYMRRRTVSFVVVSGDSSGHTAKTTVHMAKVRYGSTVKSTDGIFSTALQKAKAKFNVGGNKPVDYAWYWQTTDRVTDTNAGSTKFTSKTVTADLTVYLVIRYGGVVWYCDRTERQRRNFVAYGTWIPANDAALESRIKLPNCTPGWRGWYLDEMAPSLHPELAGVATAATFSTSAARASDAKFAGTYLNTPLLKLWSANLATTRFAYADGSVHVPEADAHYYPSTVSGEHETATSALRLPASDVRGVTSTLPLRHYSTAYQLLGDGTGRWRTLRPDAWHARADVSDRAFSAMTVHSDSTVYVKWTQVTADGVVDERA